MILLIIKSGILIEVNNKENSVEINPNTKPHTRVILNTIKDLLSSLIIAGKTNALNWIIKAKMSKSFPFDKDLYIPDYFAISLVFSILLIISIISW